MYRAWCRNQLTNPTLHALECTVYCHSIESVHTQNTSRTLPVFGFRGGLRTIANYLVKIVLPPLTACLELEELSPL